MKKTLVILSTVLVGIAIVGCTSVKFKNKNKVNENKISVDGQQEITDGQKEITLEEAKNIALANAGLTEEEVRFGDVHKELDDGISKYEIEFHAGNVEYDYEIDANSGEVIASNIDR